MDTLEIRFMPETSTNLASDVLDFLTAFIPYSVVFGIFWKIIDAVLSYANAGRDARTKELISEATEPLSKDIRELTQSIGALGERISKMK